MIIIKYIKNNFIRNKRLVHTESFELSPFWVTGIVDAEGNFSINYSKKNDKLNFSFKITQKGHSLVILHDLKNYFGCGSISVDNSMFDAYKYLVSNKEDLINIIIPHFDKYPLVGSKHLDFLDFKRAIFLSRENLGEILSIKKNMNKKRSFEERWNFLNKSSLDFKPEWLQAFIDGEGCFYCEIVNTPIREKPVLNVGLTLEIGQNSHDVKVLDAIKQYFGKGYLNPKYDISSLDETRKSRSVSRFILRNTEAVIDFVEKYPLFTRKHLDYLDWKKLVLLKADNAHKTEEGKLSMIDIKKGMNRGRANILNNNLLSNFDKLKFIRWYDISKKSYHTSSNNKFRPGPSKP